MGSRRPPLRHGRGAPPARAPRCGLRFLWRLRRPAAPARPKAAPGAAPLECSSALTECIGRFDGIAARGNLGESIPLGAGAAKDGRRRRAERFLPARPPKKRDCQGPQPLPFHPALTACTSERSAGLRVGTRCFSPPGGFWTLDGKRLSCQSRERIDRKSGRNGSLPLSVSANPLSGTAAAQSRFSK